MEEPRHATRTLDVNMAMNYPKFKTRDNWCLETINEANGIKSTKNKDKKELGNIFNSYQPDNYPKSRLGNLYAKKFNAFGSENDLNLQKFSSVKDVKRKLRNKIPEEKISRDKKKEAKSKKIRKKRTKKKSSLKFYQKGGVTSFFSQSRREILAKNHEKTGSVSYFNKMKTPMKIRKKKDHRTSIRQTVPQKTSKK